MAPALQLTEDEIDDLIYLSRVGELVDLAETLDAIANKDGSKATHAAILAAVRNEGKNSCLHMAAANGHEKTVQYLLDQFDNKSDLQTFMDSINEYENTALHWTAMNGHLPVVKLLVERGASPALANDKNFVPLDLAGLNDKVDVVDYFLAVSKEAEKKEEEEEKGKSVADEGLSNATAAVALGDEEPEESTEEVQAKAGKA